MLSKEERMEAKRLEVEQLIAERLPSADVSTIDIAVRVHKGGLLKVYLRDTLEKTRRAEVRH